MIGFSALGLLRFSVYKSAAGVAVGVAVLLIVLLTLNMFFMTTMGKTMFWPVKTFNGESKVRSGVFFPSIPWPIQSLRWS